jgi:hypothetical protein
VNAVDHLDERVVSSAFERRVDPLSIRGPCLFDVRAAISRVWFVERREPVVNCRADVLDQGLLFGEARSVVTGDDKRNYLSGMTSSTSSDVTGASGWRVPQPPAALIGPAPRSGSLRRSAPVHDAVDQQGGRAV